MLDCIFNGNMVHSFLVRGNITCGCCQPALTEKRCMTQVLATSGWHVKMQ